MLTLMPDAQFDGWITAEVMSEMTGAHVSDLKAKAKHQRYAEDNPPPGAPTREPKNPSQTLILLRLPAPLGLTG